MAGSSGEFDKYLNIKAWFGNTQTIGGWFDSTFISPPYANLAWVEVELPTVQSIAQGYAKVFVSGSWQLKPVKVWNGSSWVIKPLKTWNGSSWVAH